MRPDQHKQKKSAQYKKKHGIETNDKIDQTKGKPPDRGGRGKNRGQGEKRQENVKVETTSTRRENENSRRPLIHASAAEADSSSGEEKVGMPCHVRRRMANHL